MRERMTDPKPAMTVGERVLLTSREAAAYLRIARTTLLKYERDGLVECVRFPGMRRKKLFTREALDKFIANNQDNHAGHIAGHIEETDIRQLPDSLDRKPRVQKPRKHGDPQWRLHVARK